jgi:glycine cleavage system H protein
MSTNVPAELQYVASHEWIRQEADGSVTIGITDHAQEALGDVVFLELPEIDRQVVAGESCAVIESVKAASDIYAPLSGTVIAVNDEVLNAPEAVNSDAYSAWLFKLQPSDPAEFAQLLDAVAYAEISAS